MAKSNPVDGDAGAMSPDPMQNDPQDPVRTKSDASAGRPELKPRGGARGRRQAPGGIRGRALGVHEFFTRDVWSRNLSSLPTFRRWGYSLARVVQLTCANFVKDRCSWRASALTYITVLSLVPMLALAFSVAKGMGAYDELQNKAIIPFLDRTFGSGDSGSAIDEDVAAADAALTNEGEPGDLSADDPSGDDSPPEAQESEGASDAASAAGADPASEPALEPASSSATGAGTDTGTDAGTDAGTDSEATQSEAEDVSAEGDGSEQEPLLEDVAEAAEAAKAAGTDPVRGAIDTVLGFVEKTDVSRLGALGFLVVLWTVIKLLGAIELSFNDIWGVRKSRSLPRKVADYFSTVVLVPLLLVTGTTVMGLARSEKFSERFGISGDGEFFAQFSSLAVVWIGFAFAYILMPNTRIRVSSALVGGIVGGTMWQMFQWAHLRLQLGVANYNAIYSTFAALPIFLFWVQSSWMTVLLGAEAAAAHQNQARHGQLVRSRDYDLAQKEGLALRLMTHVARAFVDGDAPHRCDDLAEDLECPERTLEEVARSLESAGILAMADADDEDPTMILAKDPGVVRLQDVLDALKGESIEGRNKMERGDHGVPLQALGDTLDHTVEHAFLQFRQERDAGTTNMTLRDLATSIPA